MEASKSKGKRVLSSSLETIVHKLEQRESRTLDSIKMTCKNCNASGELKNIFVLEDTIRCKNCGFAVNDFQFDNEKSLKEISKKSGYMTRIVLEYLLRRIYFHELIKDERISNILSQLGTPGFNKPKLGYSIKSKDEVYLSKGDYHMMENCLNVEIPLRIMIALVGEALIKGKSETTVNTKVCGCVIPDHTRDDVTAEKVCDVKVTLNLEGDEPIVNFHPPEEFYRLLDT